MALLFSQWQCPPTEATSRVTAIYGIDFALWKCETAQKLHPQGKTTYCAIDMTLNSKLGRHPSIGQTAYHMLEIVEKDGEGESIEHGDSLKIKTKLIKDEVGKHSCTHTKDSRNQESLPQKTGSQLQVSELGLP